VARFIRSGIQEIEILAWYESGPSDTFMDFQNEFFARQFLRGFMNDPLNMMALRETLVELLSITNISKLTDDEILDQLAWQIVHGSVKLLQHEYSPATGSGRSGVTAEVEEEEGQVQEQDQAEPAAGITQDVAQEDNNWITFQIIDDKMNQPMSDVVLKIKLPTGSVNQYTTNANGLVRIDNLPSGTCDIEEIINSDALEIVQVERS
jgi:hypothetical protein